MSITESTDQIADGAVQDDDAYMPVSLVGGPRAYAGLVMEDVYTRWEILRVPFHELGADLPEPGDLRPSPPVAQYRPLSLEEPQVWHFTGWHPTSAEPGHEGPAGPR
ncbi:hypothetical protein GCM10007079_23160 [Nocardiopsis terrae]|uniref:Uncharacterized protein n=1 Tax=Nocardiopsis terrae TaxID=372655 RepID=A0ABR9HGB6_9ACTN|nr:hypothetical protein [Nocardiopsis terrae]MBE1458076.1 hypothetical protein [Nocardiopsis terrae]GHC82318.1 hypothetical protein GCM10007079_23160 [Nocardiopsis terrae]